MKILNAPENEGKTDKNEGNEGKNEGENTKSISKQNLKELILLEKVPHFECQFCGKRFSRKDNLQRHISVCKLVLTFPEHQTAPISTEKCSKNVQFQCTFCNQIFSRNYTLNRHYERCKLRPNSHDTSQQEFENKLLKQQLQHQQQLLDQKDLTIQIAKQSKQIIHNTTNKTINYLNSNYGEMIAMEKFLYNLEHTEQLTQEERQKLLMSYKDSGIELFARSFSHIMKENCRRQLLKEGLPEMNIIPLYCSDGNLRSHKEKGNQGWNTHYDDHSLNKMINISSDQVYESYRKSLMIFGKERNKVFKQIKQDNHSQNESSKKITKIK